MEDTEWNDILREKGIIPEITTNELDAIIDKVIDEHEKPKNEEDLEDLMDDFEYQKFRQNRITELRKIQKNEKFGTIEEITRSEWKTVVTDASEFTWVICCLYQSNPDSELLLKILARLVEKYPSVKFIKVYIS
jgi:uncharacterized membrane protein YheB (UPF0754 family)